MSSQTRFWFLGLVPDDARTACFTLSRSDWLAGPRVCQAPPGGIEDEGFTQAVVPRQQVNARGRMEAKASSKHFDKCETGEHALIVLVSDSPSFAEARS